MLPMKSTDFLNSYNVMSEPKDKSKIVPELDYFYHVTFRYKKNKILKNGIVPQKRSTYANYFGRRLKEKDIIYVFSNFHDAVGWGAKMRYDFQKPIIITRFRGKIEEYERDAHFQSAGAKGLWLKKKGSIMSTDIIDVIDVTEELVRTFVRKQNEYKELRYEQWMATIIP